MIQETQREKLIVRTSFIGIAANVLLAVLKGVVGLFSHSIAIVLDALNNLSDALSSIITIIGTRLSLKPATKKHPFGNGRTEYLSALIISVIILYAGVTSLVESLKKIFSPEVPNYNSLSIVLLLVAIVVKILLGLFVKAQGKKANSSSLVASGEDALMDSIVSLATVLAAVVFLVFKVSVEAFLGLAISLLIAKSGIELIADTVSDILGERIDGGLSKEIKKTVSDVDEEISGAYDLVLNDYGPDRLLGSIHIEVPASWNAEKIDSTTRKIQEIVFEKHNVVLSAVGIYSVNTDGAAAAHIREEVKALSEKFPDILQVHGLFADLEHKIITLDAVVSFDAEDMHEVVKCFSEEIKSVYKDYDVRVQLDRDISD